MLHSATAHRTNTASRKAPRWGFDGASCDHYKWRYTYHPPACTERSPDMTWKCEVVTALSEEDIRTIYFLSMSFITNSQVTHYDRTVLIEIQVLEMIFLV